MHRKILALILIIAVAAVIGYLVIQDRHKPSTPVPPQAEDREDVDDLQRIIAGMSIEEKVGQLVVVGLEGYELDERATRLIETYQVGGFILFKRNIRSVDQAINLVNALKARNAVNKIPLFLGVDEEGGRVSRAPADFARLPTSRSIGERNDPDLALQVGKVLAQIVKAIGLNLNFAPVLDVNSNPDNPVIGDRAFGSEPQVVSSLGIQTMKGLQAEGVISVVKHFPGHGDTAVDSHVGLPRVDNDLERLKALELPPFEQAIKKGADAVMIAHILLPQIDPDNPATFSPAIITDLLRSELGFTGVVITDDLTMGAIVNNFEIGEAAVRSIKAGSDIVLVCHDYLLEEAVIKAITAAAKSGEISEDRLNQSVYRILKLKEKYRIADEPVRAGDVEKINAEIIRLQNVI